MSSDLRNRLIALRDELLSANVFRSKLVAEIAIARVLLAVVGELHRSCVLPRPDDNAIEQCNSGSVQHNE
jgi:hypothetical protein